MGTIILAFVLLSGGMMYETFTLHGAMRHIAADSQSLRTGNLFELAVLSAAEQDSPWLQSGDSRYRQAKQVYLGEADRLIEQMKREAFSPEEAALVRLVEMDYRAYRSSALVPPKGTTGPRPEERVLQSLHRLRDLTTREMATTIHESDRRESRIHTWSMVLIGLSVALLVVGAVKLWSRIFRPTLELSKAARAFGNGEMTARVPVGRRDEMSDVAETFNAMADAITSRERERLDFMATIAHDLKNPLAIINGAALWLQDEDCTKEEKAEFTAAIISKVAFIESMIGELTEAVQVETGRLTLHVDELDLGAMVGRIVNETARTTASHSIQFHGPAEACRVCGDERRLERVVCNLISNGVKYSPPGTEVTVAVTRQGDSALVSVTDRGVGIAPEDMRKLFLPFSRLEKTRAIKGTGLGLSSVKKIVEAHGGTLLLTSAQGEGTTVEVWLPLIDSPGAIRKAVVDLGVEVPGLTSEEARR